MLLLTFTDSIRTGLKVDGHGRFPGVFHLHDGRWLDRSQATAAEFANWSIRTPWIHKATDVNSSRFLLATQIRLQLDKQDTVEDKHR